MQARVKIQTIILIDFDWFSYSCGCISTDLSKVVKLFYLIVFQGAKEVNFSVFNWQRSRD